MTSRKDLQDSTTNKLQVTSYKFSKTFANFVLYSVNVWPFFTKSVSLSDIYDNF